MGQARTRCISILIKSVLELVATHSKVDLHFTLAQIFIEAAAAKQDVTIMKY